MLRVGEGRRDITPPIGTALSGFHRIPGEERLSTGVRQAAAAKALVLDDGRCRVAIVTTDLCGFSRAYADRARRSVADQTGLQASDVHLHASHTHSMPTLYAFRQWGDVPAQDYQIRLESQIVAAVAEAIEGLAEARLSVGSGPVVGGSFNRTASAWRTDAEFSPEATDEDRWLDTRLHALLFERARPQADLLWYHFSAHPVCFTDELMGPDWPGIVADRTRDSDGLSPAFLQGHCGDVNPGPGEPWIGHPEDTSDAIHRGLVDAIGAVEPVDVDAIDVVRGSAELLFDLDLQEAWLSEYRDDPSACASGQWVDAPFAEAWYEDMRRWDPAQTTYRAPISAIRIGPLALLFHPGELYSFYGLQLRNLNHFPHTIVVGYTDDFVGYLADPRAYEDDEYAAVVVPKITGLPPFRPSAARAFTTQLGHLLESLG